MEVRPGTEFTSTSDIDWTKTIPEIDQQLYAKYGLDSEEIAFIEARSSRWNDHWRGVPEVDSEPGSPGPAERPQDPRHRYRRVVRRRRPDDRVRDGAGGSKSPVAQALRARVMQHNPPSVPARARVGHDPRPPRYYHGSVRRHTELIRRAKY